MSKRKGPRGRGPFPSPDSVCRGRLTNRPATISPTDYPLLENQLQSQLNFASGAAAEHGVCVGHIRCFAGAAELSCRRIICSDQVGVSVIGEIEDVKEFGAELGREAFLEGLVLENGEVQLAEGRTDQGVPALVAKVTSPGRAARSRAVETSGQRGAWRGKRSEVEELRGIAVVVFDGADDVWL